MSADGNPGHDPRRLPSEAAGTAPGRGRLNGRHLVVVGAGALANADEDRPVGNGQAISILASREGAAVACVDIDPSAAAETVDRIHTEGGTAAAIVADVVADHHGCQQLVADATDQLGSIDHLVLNVGIGAGSRIAGTSPSDWDRAFAINVRAHFLICQALLEQDTVRSIVFVSSIAAMRAGSRVPAYDASKAAVLGLNRSVAAEVARRSARANAVVPGLIDTPLGRLASAARPGRRATAVPLGRQGTAWEVAYATVFLLSDEASYITGQTLVVDGGLTGA